MMLKSICTTLALYLKLLRKLLFIDSFSICNNWFRHSGLFPNQMSVWRRDMEVYCRSDGTHCGRNIVLDSKFIKGWFVMVSTCAWRHATTGVVRIITAIVPSESDRWFLSSTDISLLPWMILLNFLRHWGHVFSRFDHLTIHFLQNLWSQQSSEASFRFVMSLRHMQQVTFSFTVFFGCCIRFLSFVRAMVIKWMWLVIYTVCVCVGCVSVWVSVWCWYVGPMDNHKKWFNTGVIKQYYATIVAFSGLWCWYPANWISSSSTFFKLSLFLAIVSLGRG